MPCKSKPTMKITRPGCPLGLVKGCDVTGTRGRLPCQCGSEFVFRALDAFPESSFASRDSLSALTWSNGICEKQRSSSGTWIGHGIFPSLKLMAFCSERLSVRPASFCPDLVWEQYDLRYTLGLFRRRRHKGPGETLASGSAWIATLLQKSSPVCLLS